MIIGPDVAWRISLDSGLAIPGATITGEVAFQPHRTITARSVTAALIATERVREQRGKSEQLIEYEHVRVPVPLLGPGKLEGGQYQARRFTVDVPTDAPPSLESDALQMGWRLEAWIDVGDARDPRASVPVFVPFSVGPDDLPNGPAANLQLDPDSRLVVAGVTVAPTPLQAGRPYVAWVDSWTPLPSGSHLDLEFRADLTVDTLLRSSTRTLDARALDAGVPQTPSPGRSFYRYTVGGPVPPGPFPTVRLSHGATTSALDVVLNLPGRADAHARLPVTIGTSDAAAACAAATFPPAPTPPPGWGNDAAISELRDRFASGEIDEADFQARLDALKES